MKKTSAPIGVQAVQLTALCILWPSPPPGKNLKGGKRRKKSDKTHVKIPLLSLNDPALIKYQHYDIPTDRPTDGLIGKFKFQLSFMLELRAAIPNGLICPPARKPVILRFALSASWRTCILVIQFKLDSKYKECCQDRIFYQQRLYAFFVVCVKLCVCLFVSLS